MRKRFAALGVLCALLPGLRRPRFPQPPPF